MDNSHRDTYEIGNRLQIILGKHPADCHVINLDTQEKIKGIVRLEIVADAASNEPPSLILHLRPKYVEIHGRLTEVVR